MDCKVLRDRYYSLLKGYCSDGQEAPLNEAAELGRALWQADIPIEDIVEIHEHALSMLAKEFPQMKLLETAARISKPLMEVLIAYGLSFREPRESEEKIHELYCAVEQSPSIVMMTDPRGRIEYVNPRFSEVTGYPAREVMGENPRFLKSGETSPEEYRVLWETISSGGKWRGEFHNRKKNGQMYWESACISAVRDRQGEITHFLAVKEDITEQKKLYLQLLQAQKMETVGRLAGGVAHDFNNMMTVVLGHCEVLLRNLRNGDPTRKNIEEIKKAGQRASSLTHQLLAFSRKQVLQPQVINLNQSVSTMSKMLQRLIGEDIKLVTILDPELGQVKADPGQIGQVILNLAVNARDAMPGGGTLTIETLNTCLDESTWADKNVTVNYGPYVMLAVSDTGAGMDAETQRRIFEPFFTTKEEGRGTGLGLSTSYGIIKQSGGYIWAYSEPGRGATFKVYLPRVDEEADAGGREQTATGSLTGSETILLVEDEDMVRELIRLSLLEYGYSILEARDGASALQLCEQHENQIGLVLSDVVLPDISGVDLAEKITSRRPEMKVIFMSGYTDDSIHRRGVLDPGVDFIQKPFTPATIAQKVRAVLGTPDIS